MKRSLQLLLLLIVGTACGQNEPLGLPGEITNAPVSARRPGAPPFGPVPVPPQGPPVWAGEPAALTIVKTAFPNDRTVFPGESFSFDITVTNNGPGTASRVWLTDDMPDFASGFTVDGLLCIGIDPLQCGVIRDDPDSDINQFTGVDIAPGEAVTVTITFDNDQEDCGTVTNTAAAVADNAPEVSDSASVVVICPTSP